MYYGTKKDKLLLDYPIINYGVGGDYILVYLSLDGVPTIQSHIALFQDNYDIEDCILNYCEDDDDWNKKISLGQVMIRPADEVFDKNILLVFVKESFYDNLNIEHIKSGLNRLVSIYKDYGIESISIDKDIFEESIFDEFLKEVDLPKINII